LLIKNDGFGIVQNADVNKDLKIILWSNNLWVKAFDDETILKDYCSLN